MCVDKREISIQADIAIEKNKNFKKEESQRQKEKQQKAAELKEKEKKEEKPVVSGPVEEPTNEYEKKVFDVLNAMGIAHVREREENNVQTTVHHEAAQTVEDVVKYCDRSLGLPTKNLFLKVP